VKVGKGGVLEFAKSGCFPGEVAAYFVDTKPQTNSFPEILHHGSCQLQKIFLLSKMIQNNGVVGGFNSTHLKKHYIVKLGSSSPRFGVEITNI